MKLQTLKLSILILVTQFALQGSASAEGQKYMGVATCSSSNCHGAAVPRNSTNVLQNEYTTWAKKDAHSKAWRVLTTSDSKKIGANLGIENPAQEPLCLKCHSTYVPKEVHGEKFAIEDGVSCEACHGAAEGWLKSHTSSSATHKRNVENGMRDFSNLQERAKYCLTCHQGNDNQFVDHRLIGAGHPRLSFELDTYSMIQPKHWNYDQDYEERKGKYEPTRAWLIGQVEVARGALALMSSEKRSKNGIWPELTMFNCYACHHSLTQKQWRAREYKNGPGELRLNVSSLIIIHDAMVEVAPDIAIKMEEGLQKLHDAYKTGQAGSIISNLDTILKNDVERLARVHPLDQKTSAQLLKSVVNFAASTPHLQYEEAEQLAMGISALLSVDSVREKRFKKQVDDIYKSLKSPEEFVAEEFTAAADALKKSL